MKQKLFKSWLLMMCLLFGVGQSWAADKTGTIKFGTNDVKINAASVTGKDDLGNSWTITTVGTTSYTTNAAYYQVGSSNKPATSITFTTTLPKAVNIKSMSAKFGGFSGTAGSVALKVGDTTIGTGSLNAANDVTVNSTSTAKGTVLTVTVTGIAKGVKVYNVSYTMEDEGSSGGDTPTPEPTKYDVTVANIANGTVTANPTSAASGATVTLTATPATGYEFGTWNVTNASTSEAITVTDNKFTMPAANVNVSATFNEVQGGGDEPGGDEATVTWVASEQGYTNGVQYTSATVDENISLAFGDGGNDGKYYNTGSGIRIYSNGKITVSAAEGCTMSKIVITYSDSGYTGTFSANTGEYKLSNTTGTWTGSASSVVLTNTATSVHARIQKIAVTYASNGDTPVKTQCTVTIDAPENGTLVVKNGENVLSSGDKVEEGTTLTVECAPNDGYRYKNWQYKEGDADWVEMTTDMTHKVAKDISIHANFELVPTYSVTWSVNGSIAKTDNVMDGSAVTAPSVPTFEGYAFEGWTDAAIENEVENKPEYVTLSDQGYSPTDNITLYAVYKRISSDGSSAKDIELRYDNTDMPSKYEETSITIDGLTLHLSNVGRFQDWSTKELYNYFQVKKADNGKTDYGRIYTNDNSQVSVNSITVNFNEDNENSANLYVLYGDNKSVKLDNTTKSCTLGGVSEFEINADQTGRVVKVESIVFKCTTSGKAYYTTLIPLAPEYEEQHVDFVASTGTTVGTDMYYATFSKVNDVFIPGEEITVYTVSVSGDNLTFNELKAVNVEIGGNTYSGYYVPANNGVLMSTAYDGAYATATPWKTVSYYDVENVSIKPLAEGNMLYPASKAMSELPNSKFYKLAYDASNTTENILGFYYGATDGAAFTPRSGAAYLAVPSDPDVKIVGFRLPTDDTTGINAINNVEVKNDAVYNLNGQRISSNETFKGIVIVNGRKYLRK